MRNDIAFVEASVAVGRLGAYAVPLNWHTNAGELRYILDDCGARVVVVHADLVSLLDEAAADGVVTLWVETPPEVAHSYGIGASACHVPEDRLGWESLIGTHGPYAGQLRRSGSIAYTSGTTGLPKGIQPELLAPELERASTARRSLTFGIRTGVRSLISGPLYHSMQSSNMRAVLGALGEEGLMVVEPRFDAERLLALVEQHRITQLMLVPVMFVRLLRLPESVRRRYDVSSVEWVIHSAAPCPVDVKKRMIEWWGPVINEFYGSTETGPVTFVGSQDYLRKPGTVGKVIPGCTVKVLDEDGRELPPGTPGEIAGHNPLHPPFTYRNCPGEREKLDRGGGLLASGDIGYFDEEGFLFICDRKKDMVISGGVNIFPAEIEALLLALPGVKDCAVFGIPDEEYGEVLAAHIEPLPGAVISEAAVCEHLRSRIGGLKVPRIVRFDPWLPREDNGKIYKRRIAEPYWKAAGRRI
jgi:long-chain acyl-CoA synthetase